MKKILLLITLLLSAYLHAQCWNKVATGSHHTLAIKDDGTLWSWGNDSHWQLGNEEGMGKISPDKISEDTDWVGVYAGRFNSMAIKSNGTLWGWGGNYSGQVGNGTQDGVLLPQQIGTDTDWVMISCRGEFTAAIKANGTLWTWGDNSYVQLGTGSLQGSIVPQQVGTDTDWKTVSAGIYNTIAIKTNGTLWGWGTNVGGMLGNGFNPYPGEDNYYYVSPVQIGTEADWDFVSAGANFTAAIKTNGTLWTWGFNNQGQLGDGTTEPKYLPQQLGTDTWQYVTCNSNEGLFYCIALRSDGSLWSWGNNLIGQLGTGSIVASLVPLKIGQDTDWATCTTGEAFSSGLKTDNSLYMWGSNNYGQFGNGNYGDTPYTSPIYTSCEVLSTTNLRTVPFTVYPNPVNDVLYIKQQDNYTIQTITITDFAGKIVLEQGPGQAVNVGELALGMYIIKVQLGTYTYQQKFIKQ